MSIQILCKLVNVFALHVLKGLTGDKVQLMESPGITRTTNSEKRKTSESSQVIA